MAFACKRLMCRTKTMFLADHLSRHLYSPLEWSLKQEVANQIFQMWEWPQMDLFAKKENAKLPQFCALTYQPVAQSKDGLNIRLNQNC